MTEGESLPSDVRALLAEEKAAISAPAGARERIRARVRATLGAGSPPGSGGEPSPQDSSASGASSVARRLFPHLMTFALGAAGASLVAFARQPAPVPPRVVYLERSATAPGAVGAVDAVPSVEPAALPDAPPASSVAPAYALVLAKSAASAHAPRTDAGQLAAERAVLDVARTALVRGDADAALTALGEHERRFATGVLQEEREAMTVQALMLANRDAEARVRGKRFLERFPNSVLHPAVEAAVDAGP